MNDDRNLLQDASFSIEKYRHHIAHLGLPREHETEMIKTLALFLCGCVDRAFGHDPIQLAAGDRLQLSDEVRIPTVVGLEPISNNQHDLSGAFEDADDARQRKRQPCP